MFPFNYFFSDRKIFIDDVQEEISCLHISGGSKYLAYAISDGWIRIVDLRKQLEVQKFKVIFHAINLRK